MEGTWDGSEGNKGGNGWDVLGVGVGHSVCPESPHQWEGGVEEVRVGVVVFAVLSRIWLCQSVAK